MSKSLKNQNLNMSHSLINVYLFLQLVYLYQDSSQIHNWTKSHKLN